MLSRLLPKPSHFRLLSLISLPSQSHPQNPLLNLSRFLSSSDGGSGNNNHNGNGKNQSSSNLWKLSQESNEKFETLLTDDSANLAGITGASTGDGQEEESWVDGKGSDEDIFGGIEGGGEVAEKSGGVGGGEDEWVTAEGYQTWSLEEEEDVGKDDIFDIGASGGEVGESGGSSSFVEDDRIEEERRLEREEKELSAILKGPNRAFGDLVAATGITDAMLDSLIALKDLEEVDGLPPLSEIEDMRYEKNTRRSTRAEIELQKQEEYAKARVRQVDDKGRAYGTGRRKCSVARVWVQPGDGKFVVNDKQFDVYFPILDHRAALLRPFSETKTLGLWDVNCTVKGGGVSGQVGAIQLGISRALQNWEPDLRPPLRNAGFLTRDSRVVERKKPGKAKARKSFQWVKR